jgi:hypothetical protein
MNTTPFAHVCWSDFDIMDALEFKDMDVTPEMVAEIRLRCEKNDNLVRAMIAAGWDTIYNIIDDIRRETNP